LRSAPKARTSLTGVCALVLLRLLAACAGQPVNLSSEAIAALPAAHRIEALPFHPQVEDQCGPASLATMLGYRGIPVDPESLRDKLYVPGKEGTLTTEMIARARRYGLLVYPLRPELADLLVEVAAGNPVLVMQNLSFNWLPRWHFSLVIGYDLGRRELILRSGNEPSLEVNFELFLKTWDRAQRQGMVMLHPSGIPATAEASRFIGAAHELELVGESRAALQAYETAIAHWPSSGTAWFAAGNTAYQLGAFSEAIGFYKGYIRVSPSAAAGWNNLAYPLMQLGCHRQALRAVQCALQFEPDNPEFLDSLEALSNPPEAIYSSACSLPTCQAPPP